LTLLSTPAQIARALWPRPKAPAPASVRSNGLDGDARELGVQVVGDRLGHLAEEAQGDVEGLGVAPARVVQAVLVRLELLGDLGRDLDGGEQAQHGAHISETPRL
jgi:hypothetical protein